MVFIINLKFYFLKTLPKDVTNCQRERESRDKKPCPFPLVRLPRKDFKEKPLQDLKTNPAVTLHNL